MIDIPDDLRNLNQWLCWQFGERDGKPTKIPINPHTGNPTNAPAAEWSYEECIAAAAEHGYGIGFSLKNGIFGVDFDHVLDENGQLKPEYARLSEIVDKIGSYTEISPSGEGLHIFARCDDIPQECQTCRKQNVPIEMYCEKRYITVTGDAWKYGGVLRTLSGDEYREIHSKLFGTPTPAPTTEAEQARDEPSPKNTPIIPATKLRGVLDSVITSTSQWAVLINDTIPKTPSEAFQSVCTRIAGDLGQMEAYMGLDWILTAANIREVWEQTEIYQHHYAGESKYAAHKIDPTLQKALIYGQKQKKDALKASEWMKKTSQKTDTEPEPQAEPEPPKHPEGFCISEDGVPEFWCDEYDHPLRYHMAHIARYAQAAMHQTNAITAWICAVFFGTVVCARQYAAELTPFGNSDSALTFPCLYAIVSGKSGAGKNDIKNGLNALVKAIAEGGKNQKVWGLISPKSNWTSDAAVQAAIALHPQSVAFWDECGEKIQRAQKDVIANSMLRKITEAFSCANDVLRAPLYANPKAQQLPKGTDVWHPAMSIVGMGTPRQMEAITEDMVESGQFARFLFYTIPMRITKPVERVDFNLQTHSVITEILRTATFSPEIRPTARQELLKVLRWDPNAPQSALDVRNSVRELAIAAKSSADTAILNRVFEVAVILAISRTILGTKHGTNAEYVPYDIMMECIAEAKKSMWHFHSIVVDAPVFSPRERRIADAIDEIFRNRLNSPFRAYYGTEIAPILKKMHLTVSGKNGERQNVDAILTSRGIAAGKEGNIPTGRKYYYDASSPTAQAEQDEYDLQLRNAAKTASREDAN